jgi:hypothetical protein
MPKHIRSGGKGQVFQTFPKVIMAIEKTNFLILIPLSSIEHFNSNK